MSYKRLVEIYPNGATSNDTFTTGDMFISGNEIKFKDLLINADSAKEAETAKTIKRLEKGNLATAGDSVLTFNSQELGKAGNDIVVNIKVLKEAESVSVSVSKKTINVSCPTKTTASDIADAVNGSAKAIKLVECIAGSGKVASKTYNLEGGTDTPAGVDGEIRFDNDHLFIFVNDSWKSIAII